MIYDEFVLNISCFEIEYARIKERWEGVGIKPDMEVEADKAYSKAHLFLLDKLLENAGSPTLKERYQWALDGVNSKNTPCKISESNSRNYIGKFGNREILYIDEDLYYQYKGRAKRKMTGVNEHYFVVEGYDYFRVKITEDDSKVSDKSTPS